MVWTIQMFSFLLFEKCVYFIALVRQLFGVMLPMGLSTKPIKKKYPNHKIIPAQLCTSPYYMYFKNHGFKPEEKVHLALSYAKLSSVKSFSNIYWKI